MAIKSITVIHIDTGQGWRGGQQQAAYLFEAMVRADEKTAMVCQPNSPFYHYCCKGSLPVHPIRMRGEFDIIAGARIARIARRMHADILHLHTAHAATIGLWAKLFYPRVKLIAVRRVDFKIGKSFLSRFKYSTSMMNRIVCISQAIYHVMQRCGIAAQKLMVIHSGVALNRYTNVSLPPNFKVSLGIPYDAVVVGTIASMVGHKDYPNFLKAAQRVLQKNDNVYFCAVGDGPQQEKIEALKVALSLGDRFILTGFRTDVGNFLQIFDIFVLASKKEGLGTSVLDAQAVGLPVVGTATGGIPEMLIEDENGFIVPPSNAAVLAEQITTLVTSQELRVAFGKVAAETVKEFDIAHTIEQNRALYHELVTT